MTNPMIERVAAGIAKAIGLNYESLGESASPTKPPFGPVEWIYGRPHWRMLARAAI